MNSILPFIVVITLLVTFYSLYDLHRVSILTIHSEKLLVSYSNNSSSSPLASPNPSSVVASNVSTRSSLSTSPSLSITPVVNSFPPPSGNTLGKCQFSRNTEVWGEVVSWGPNNIQPSEQDCCNSCLNFKAEPGKFGCNVWAYCGDKEKCKTEYGHCWLKHLPHPMATKPKAQGPDVAWTSGTSGGPLQAQPIPTAHTGRKYHVVTSVQGSAVHWQIRIHYYHYKKVKAACDRLELCDMGGFTRLLHSGHPDDLMDEIPSFVVDPLPASAVKNDWYVVLNRPYAFVQWTQKVTIPEKYVLMSEPDHIFLRPIPNMMLGDNPAAFPFFYIEPSKASTTRLVEKFVGTSDVNELDKIAPIGSSPTFMTFTDMARSMPLWMNISIDVFKDPVAQKEWGWVQEMYGFAFALYRSGIRDVGLYLQLMAQPPWDTSMDYAPGMPFQILHYTYGMDYKLTGEFTPGVVGQWRFDKRTYSNRPPRRDFPHVPPDGMKNDLVRRLMESFSEAMNAIPCWDEYAVTGNAVFNCAEAQQKPLLKDIKF